MDWIICVSVYVVLAFQIEEYRRRQEDEGIERRWHRWWRPVTWLIEKVL